MRSALVDYFRDEGRIMIATEAGAEGINLQFCSLVVNYDLPASIDDVSYAADVLTIRQGQGFTRLEYTFNNPEVVPQNLVFQPAPIVIVEGIFVFYFEEVAKLLDLKVYIDAEEHIKLHRRIVRDKVERGYDLDDVLYRYQHHVAPTYEKYIKPYKQDADIVIPNNRHFDRGLEVLTTFLQTKVQQYRQPADVNAEI